MNQKCKGCDIVVAAIEIEEKYFQCPHCATINEIEGKNK